MAKHRAVEDHSGSSSLEVVWVRLNGSNNTIESALRTIQGIKNNVAPARQLPGRVAELPSGKNGNPDKPQQHQQQEMFNDQEEVLDAEVVESPTLSVPPGSLGRKPKFRIPKVIPDLDFNDVSPTFREYAELKKPSDQFDWYLLVSQWMKMHKQIEEIGVDEIITAAKYLGAAVWSVPDDAGQPFRDGRRQGLFVKGSKNGVSKITKNGEDRVARMGQKE